MSLRRKSIAPTDFGAESILSATMGSFLGSAQLGRRLARSRRNCCRRRWRVAITAVRYYVRVLLVYRRAVLLSPGERAHIVERMGAYISERGPIVGARALHRALGATELAPEVALDVAAELFEEVDGRSNCGMTMEQVLKVCKKIKAARLEGSQSEAAQAFEAVAAQHPQPSAEVEPPQPSPSPERGAPRGPIPWQAVEDAVKQFGLKVDPPAPPPMPSRQPSASPLRAESSTSFRRADAEGDTAPPCDVTFDAFVEQVFDGRANVSRGARAHIRSGRDFLRQHSSEGATGAHDSKVHASKRRDGGRGTRRPTRAAAESVTSGTSTYGDLRSVPDIDEAAASPDRPVADEDAAPSAGRQLAARLRSVVSDHGMHVRQVRGKAQHVQDALTAGPGGAPGTWHRDASRPVVQHAPTTIKIRPNVDEAAHKMRVARGLAEPAGCTDPDAGDVVAVAAPRPRSALSVRAQSPARGGDSSGSRTGARSRPASASAVRRGRDSLLMPAEASLAAKPAPHVSAQRSRPASAQYRPSGAAAPAPQPRAATPARPLSAASTRSVERQPAATVLPHDQATREAWLQYFQTTGGDVQRAVEAAQNTFAGPRESAVAAHVPRSALATRLYRELETKTTAALAGTPAFALPPQERAAFLTRYAHARPSSEPPRTLHRTRQVAGMVLQRLSAWHPPSSTPVNAPPDADDEAAQLAAASLA